MPVSSFPTSNSKEFEKKLTEVIADARSLSEIETWLRSLPDVQSVKLSDYVLKSNPPQRDFIVELKIETGSTIKKIVHVFDLGNQQFQFHELHDE